MVIAETKPTTTSGLSELLIAAILAGGHVYSTPDEGGASIEIIRAVGDVDTYRLEFPPHVG